MLGELGTAEDRAHLAGCGACAARYRAIERDVQAFARTLAVGDPPAVRAGRRNWYWPAAAGLGAAAVAATLWLTAGVRMPAPAPHDEARQAQAAIALAEISSALFSVEGDPGRVTATPSAEGDTSSACGEWWHDDGLCGTTLGVLTGVFDPTAPGASDSLELGDD